MSFVVDYTANEGPVRIQCKCLVYYGLDLLLSKLSKAQSNEKFRVRNTRIGLSTYFAAAKYVDPILGINKSLTDT
jgi:hypothetical protein